MDQKYVPDRGDIVWLQFSPRAGHEQDHQRPALVVSPKVYNQKAGLALFCPITSQVKGYPFEVLLPEGSKAAGAILSDQVKSLDWRAGKATRLAHAPRETVKEVLGKILTLVGDVL
jgi:mRNA interferase MazF